MPVEIRVPQLTQTMTEAEIVRWIKAEGEGVKVGEPLLEVVTDKATVEVESPAAGVLGKILVSEGIVPVGKVICLLLAEGEQLAGAPAGSAAVPAASGRPDLAVASSVAPRPIGARAPGRVRISPLARRLAMEGGVDIGLLAPSGPGGLVVERDVRAYLAVGGAAVPAAPGLGAVGPGGGGQAARPTPFGAIEAAVLPTGTALTPTLSQRERENREVSQGEREIGGISQGERDAISPSPHLPVSPSSSDEEVIPLAGVRRIIADRMSLSRHTAADVTTVAEVDMGEIASLREHLPFTYTAFVARAVTLALVEHPILNSRLEGDRIVLSRRVHLGVAVAIGEGLKVPVLKDAQGMSLRQVSEGLADKAKRGAEGKLAPEELSGSTFTLTNSGVFGSLFFTPIINPPESAILGMGKIMKAPVVRDDEIVIRPMMYLCLTYDHRVIDGEQAVRFLQRVKALLEKPALML